MTKGNLILSELSYSLCSLLKALKEGDPYDECHTWISITPWYKKYDLFYVTNYVLHVVSDALNIITP